MIKMKNHRILSKLDVNYLHGQAISQKFPEDVFKSFQ